MKKLLVFGKVFIVIGVMLLVFLSVGERGSDFFPFLKKDDYTSQYIHVMERDTDNIIYEKRAKRKAYPASLVKMMTTIVTLEHISELSAPAPVDKETYQEMIAENASVAGFVGGEEVTYRDLLYGTVLASGGEAANSLAIHVAGSVEAFVQMMNDKAKEIGMHDTQFMNPEGLHHKKQYTTAYDMAQLLDYALDNVDFKAIFTKESFRTRVTVDHPEGILLTSTVLTVLNQAEQEGFKIIGGKSGTTSESGQSWATLGVVDGREYISVVMGAPLVDISHPDNAQVEDTLNLFRKITARE